jgi:uncharacterized protein YbcI
VHPPTKLRFYIDHKILQILLREYISYPKIVLTQKRKAMNPITDSPERKRTHPSTHGEILTAISDGLVALLKEFYGHGPTRAKSYYSDDLVVCVLRGGFSRVEETLLEGGRGTAVIQQRMEFQDLMRSRFEAVIENATGRQVIGFMSGNQQHPDMMCEVFILAGTDLIDHDEIPERSPVGIV